MSYSGRHTVDMMILKMSQLSAFAGLFEWNALFVDPWIHTTILFPNKTYLYSYHRLILRPSKFLHVSFSTLECKRNKRTNFCILNIST